MIYKKFKNYQASQKVLIYLSEQKMYLKISWDNIFKDK